MLIDRKDLDIKTRLIRKNLDIKTSLIRKIIDVKTRVSRKNLDIKTRLMLYRRLIQYYFIWCSLVWRSVTTEGMHSITNMERIQVTVSYGRKVPDEWQPVCRIQEVLQCLTAMTPLFRVFILWRGQRITYFITCTSKRGTCFSVSATRELWTILRKPESTKYRYNFRYAFF